MDSNLVYITFTDGSHRVIFLAGDYFNVCRLASLAYADEDVANITVECAGRPWFSMRDKDHDDCWTGFIC